MKKIIMAAAIVCVAAFAQAAAINWQSGTLYIASDAAGTTGTLSTDRANNNTRSVTMYVYALSMDDYTAAQTMDTAALYEKYSATTETGKGTTLPTGAATYNQTVGDASGANYALLLFVDEKNANLKEGEVFVKATLAMANVESNGTIAMPNMVTSAQTSNWVAVPEPTSGLLLLIGMGALALRRKQA